MVEFPSQIRSMGTQFPPYVPMSTVKEMPTSTDELPSGEEALKEVIDTLEMAESAETIDQAQQEILDVARSRLNELFEREREEIVDAVAFGD